MLSASVTAKVEAFSQMKSSSNHRASDLKGLQKPYRLFLQVFGEVSLVEWLKFPLFFRSWVMLEGLRPVCCFLICDAGMIESLCLAPSTAL